MSKKESSLEEEIGLALALEEYLCKVFDRRAKEADNPFEMALYEKQRDDSCIHAERLRNALRIMGLKIKEEVEVPERFRVFDEEREFASDLERAYFFAKIHEEIEEEATALYKRMMDKAGKRMVKTLFKANYDDEVEHHKEFRLLVEAIEKILKKGK